MTSRQEKQEQFKKDKPLLVDYLEQQGFVWQDSEVVWDAAVCYCAPTNRLPENDPRTLGLQQKEGYDYDDWDKWESLTVHPGRSPQTFWVFLHNNSHGFYLANIDNPRRDRDPFVRVRFPSSSQ